MKYNFKGYVFLGCSCNGQVHSYNDLVPIELTEEDARIICSQVQPDKHGDIMPYLQKELPRLFNIINKEASLFAKYAILHESITNGHYEEYLPEGKTIIGFIQEDIDSGIFNPPIKDSPELFVKEWYEWEEEYLHTLSYYNRIRYIVNRYLCEEDAQAVADIENKYTLSLPDELKA